MASASHQLRQRVERAFAAYLRTKVGQDSFLLASAQAEHPGESQGDRAAHLQNKAIYEDEGDERVLLEAAIVSCPDAEVKVPEAGLFEASLHLMAMVSPDSEDATVKIESIMGELDLMLYDPDPNLANPYSTAVAGINALNLGLYLYQIDKLTEGGQVTARHWVDSHVYAVACQVMD